MLSAPAPLLLSLFLPMLYALALILLSLLRTPAPLLLPLLYTSVLLLVLLLLLCYPPRSMTLPAQGEVLGLGTEGLRPHLLLWLWRPDADGRGSHTRI
jgi:hypothetical protein